MQASVALIGVGGLGEPFLAALLRSRVVSVDRVRCAVRRHSRAEELAATYGVDASTDPVAAASEADVVVLAVKPQSLPALLDELGPHLHQGQMVISLAAGVTTAVLEAASELPLPVVRVMTNTPVRVDEAMSVLAAGAHAGAEHLAIAEDLLSSVGEVRTMPEAHMDAVTAVSGSGPAYVFLLAEAMIDAGVAVGLDQASAEELVVQTIVGAAHMLRDSGRSPAELREAVSSPGGTTLAALGVLQDRGLRAAVVDAITAARDRSAELGQG